MWFHSTQQHCPYLQLDLGLARCRFMGMTFTSKSALTPTGLSETDLNQRSTELCCVIPCSRSDETYTLILLGPVICSNFARSCQLTSTSKSDSKFIGGIANSAWITALTITSTRSSRYYTGDLTADPHVCKSFPSHLLYYMKGKNVFRLTANECWSWNPIVNLGVGMFMKCFFKLTLHMHLAVWER